ELYLDLGRGTGRNGNLAMELPVLRSPAVLHRESAGRQQNDIAVPTVDLRLKIKIGGQSFRLRRKDMSGGISKRQARHGRLAIEVANPKRHGNSRTNVKEERGFASKHQILILVGRAEPEGRFALSRLVAVDEGNGIFGGQTAELGGHRRAGINLEIEKAAWSRLLLHRLFEISP